MEKNERSVRQGRALIAAVGVTLCLGGVILSLGVAQKRDKPETESTERVTESTPLYTESVPKADEPYQRDEAKPPQTKNPPETSAAVETQPEAIAEVVETLPDFIAPVSGMLCTAHSIDVPVYSVTMEDYRTHTGVDIAATQGTPVVATADGTIGEIWEEAMMGTCISIEHSGGARSVYKNLAPESAELVSPGQTVRVGTVIGAIGESALCEIAQESHLHYELEIDRASVNPADYMLLGATDTSYEG